jgi:hypothetical protein
MPKLLSNRVKVTPSEQLSQSRYQYVELNQTQPALGTPLTDKSVLLANLDGTTEWVPQDVITGNVVPNKNTIYVSKSGSDSNIGNSISSTKLTIKGALTVATAGTSIIIYAGDYTEVNPLVLPENVSIIGQDSRVNVIPKNPTQDVFKLNSGSSIDGITVVNHKYPSFAFSLKSTVNIKISPIINNCSSITGPFLADGTLFVPFVTVQNGSITPGATPLLDADVPDVNKRINITGAGGGIFIDGGEIISQSLYKSVIVDQFIASNQGGIGVQATNNATIILQNSISKFCTVGFKATNGGYIDLTSCTTEYGTYGLVSDGYLSTPYINSGIISASHFSSVSNVSITNQGSGYGSTPSVVVGTQWSTGATVATHSQLFYGSNLYFVMSGGVLGAIAPTFTNSTPTANGTATLLYTGTAATATATMSGGKITNIAFTSGSGYTSIPSITFVGSNTTPAEASAELTGISLVSVGSITKKPLVSTLISFQYNPNYYYITDATDVVGTNSNIKVSPELYYVLGNYTASLYYESRIIANGHTSKYIGAGTTLNALATNSGNPVYANETVESNHGKIFYTGVNETGLYKIGDIFTVDNITGVSSVNSNIFDLTNVSAIGPLNRSGVISGVQLREISDDITLTATTGIRDSFTAPTQHAVYTFLQNNYLALTGGTVAGTVTINDLILSGNSITSKNTNQSIILNPVGNGNLDVSGSRVINSATPVNNTDLATKEYVDNAVTGVGNTYPSINIGDFYIHGDVIENTINDANITLTTKGTGQTVITSLLDSSSSITGALVVNGGVGIATKLYVGDSVYSTTFHGNLDGAATTAGTVTTAAQPSITSVGTLTSLQVDNININGNIIKNTLLDENLILGATGTGDVIPAVHNTIDFGSNSSTWKKGYFTNIAGTLDTSSQPNISSLSSNVKIFDSTYTLTPTLDVGFSNTNKFEIETHQTSSSLTYTKFVNISSGTNNNYFEFHPDQNLALTIANGLVTVENTLHIKNTLTIDNPILKLGLDTTDIESNNDFGISFRNNYNIYSYVTSIDVTSTGSVNTVIINLNDTVANANITTNDTIHIAGANLVELNGTWNVTVASPSATTVTINVTSQIPATTYVDHPSVILLNKIGFFGYNHSNDSFTFIPDALISNNDVTGLTGTINAKINSDKVTITSGTLDNVIIGGTTANTGIFTNVLSDQVTARTTISIHDANGFGVILDTFNKNQIDSAKYVIKIKNTTTNTITVQEFLLVQDTVDIYMTEYAVINTGISFGVLSGSFDGNNVNVVFTPSTNNNISIKLIKFYT